jgi:hypothetical protein
MSLSRPNESYHFQANLIWWDRPFNETPIRIREINGTNHENKNQAHAHRYVCTVTYGMRFMSMDVTFLCSYKKKYALPPGEGGARKNYCKLTQPEIYVHKEMRCIRTGTEHIIISFLWYTGPLRILYTITGLAEGSKLRGRRKRRIKTIR